MLVNSSSIISALLNILAVNTIIKMVLVSIVASMVIRTSVSQESDVSNNRNLRSALLIAVCGTLAFQLSMWLLNGLGILVGVVAFWLVVTSVLDHFFNIDYDRSYMFTGQIVGLSVLTWIIIGSVVYLISL